MKRIYFLAPLVALAMASCSNGDFEDSASGDTSETISNKINLSGARTNVTRASGSEAAGLLDNNFIVEGVKGNGSSQTEIFDHYNVNYFSSSSNSTLSNSSDWEYVEQDQNIKGTSSKLSSVAAQTIKYWDYTTTQYDFVAVSLGKGVGTSTKTYAQLSEINTANLGKAVSTSTPVYTLTGSAEELAATYVADLVTLYNRDGVSEYKKVVTPKFQSLGTKVRIAFYETVPGYAVANVKFYATAWDGTTKTTASGVETPTIFAANNIFPSSTSNGTMSIYYSTVGWDNSGNASGATAAEDYNKVHVAFSAGTANASDALVSAKTFGDLQYTKTPEKAETCQKMLGRTSSTATYAGTGYEVVLPLGTSDNIQIRIEYDLYPIDGGAETIHVSDARAVVPSKYCDWKPNYAYTYIFKISENTNGYTGVDGDGKVVEGLTPITFDAVVVDSEDGIQQTITSVTTPSITTYQAGALTNEYHAGQTIDVTVANAETGSKLYLYQLAGDYDTSKTVDQNIAANAESYIGGATGVDATSTYTIPAAYVVKGKSIIVKYVGTDHTTYKVIKVTD